MADEDNQLEMPLEEKLPEAEISLEEPKQEEIQVIEVEDDDDKGAVRELPTDIGIAKLKADLEEQKKAYEQEKQYRLEAEKRAKEAALAAHKAKNEVQDTNLTLIRNAIDTVKRDTEMLKISYREAMQMGDYDKVADIQQMMSNNSAKLLQLENGRDRLENMPRQEEPKFNYAPNDPVEQLASQLTPRSADWVRRHPQFARDQRLMQRMIAAHNLVTTDGFVADTDEYFAEVEKILGVGQRQVQAATPVEDDAMSEAAQPVAKRQSPTPVERKQAPPAAPVSRSGTAPGSRPNTVRLTSQEREIASMMGMTDQEYAKNKLALQKEGKLNQEIKDGKCT